MPITVYNAQDEERKRRMAWGKSQGLDDATIAKYELIAKVQEQQKRQATQQQAVAQRTQPQQKKKGGFDPSAWISEAGGVVGGVGGFIVGGPAGAVAGAAAGGGLGSALEQKIRDKKVNWGKVAKTAAIEGVTTAGPVKLVKGAALGGKALLKGAGAVGAKEAFAKGATTSLVKKAAQGIGLQDLGVKNFLKLSPADVTKAREAGLELPKLMTKWSGAVKGSQNEVMGTIGERGMGGKFKNLIQQNEDVIQKAVGNSKDTIKLDDFVSEISKIQSKMVGVPGNATKRAAIDSAFDEIVKQYPNGVPKNKALEVLRAVNEKFGKSVLDVDDLSATTRDIQKAFGNSIRKGLKASPEVAKALDNQQELIVLRELMNKARDKGIAGAKLPLSGVDLTKPLSLVNPLVSNRPVARRLAGMTSKSPSTIGSVARRSLVGGVLGKESQPIEQPQQDQLPADVSLLFPDTQNPDEQMANELVGSGITDPNAMFDAMTGQGDYAQPDAGVDEMGNATPMGASSAELFKMALDTRLAGDAKGSKDLLEFAKVAAAFEKESRTTGAGAKPIKKTEGQRARDEAHQLTNKAIQQLSQGSVDTGWIGAKIQGTKEFLGKGDPETLGFNTTVSALKAAIAKARAGTSFTPNEEKLLNAYAPKAGDTGQQLETKLLSLKQVFEEAEAREYNTDQSSGSTDMFDFSDDELVQQLTEQRGY